MVIKVKQIVIQQFALGHQFYINTEAETFEAVVH